MINQEVLKKEMALYQFKKCTKDIFCKYINDKKEDKFAKTFLSKANFQNQWNFCYGLFDKDELLGAIITTYSKREPKTANLQLLHTFYAHRNKGVAKELCNKSLTLSLLNKCWYFRVSAEPEAVSFYKKIGLKMLGEQKSKCQLSMFRIQSDNFRDGIYDIQDPNIRKNVYKKGKGGCVVVFDGL
jgi:hypothetical protein|tara:strand:+ start:1645 stop:2199 length:555 start_codon:yes stop_codon:yes gene_type:complete